MSLPSDKPLQKLQFYVTTGYPCGYLPNKLAQSLIASPQHLIDASVYSGLIQQGFRRSGKFAYRPHCESCRECVSVRVIADDFKPTRSQKRAYKQHQNLETTVMPVEYHEEHFALYNAYQMVRHNEALLEKQRQAADQSTAQDGTDQECAEQDEEDQYRHFLCQTNVESVMVEFRLAGKLKMVSVIDIVIDGISAVYTFYDTTDTQASYGTYNILWQIEWTKILHLPYLYLGYWIKDSRKMVYKEKFQPQERLVDGEWLIG